MDRLVADTPRSPTGDRSFVALLRSVNVGGRNRVGMGDLRTYVASLGFAEVATYVQSGNVVFRGSGSPSSVRRMIEDGMLAELGLAVPVVVRSSTEWQRVLEATPFSGAAADPKRLHVTFLAESPTAVAVEELERRAADRDTPDRLAVVGDAVHLSIPGSYSDSPFTNAWLEKRLGTPATTRNWRTVTTLAGMAGLIPPPD